MYIQDRWSWKNEVTKGDVDNGSAGGYNKQGMS